MSELSASLLRTWPGRFRLPDLADTLAREVPSPGDLADATLLGVIGGHDEAAALQHLITSGRFRSARRLLDECPVWDGETRTALARVIEEQVRTFQQQLGADYYECRMRADAAGVSWTLRLPELEERCVDDWPSAYQELEFARGRLDQEVEDRRDDLEKRRKQDLADRPNLAAVCSSLLKSNQLEAALHLLDHGVLDVHPPEAVPAPLDLPAGGVPRDVLRWHLSPSVAPPPHIDPRWWAAKDSPAHELLVRFDGLKRGREPDARGFALALAEFLGIPIARVTFAPLDYGHLATLPGALAVPQLQGLLVPSSLELYVCEPDVARPSRDLGLERYAVVGWSLTTVDEGGRTEGAVLSLGDLLRLVTQPADPPEVRRAGLARVLARQWPLARLGAGSPAQLEQTLRRRSPWEALAWLTDITGLGGSVTAARLAHLSGEYDPELLFALLERMAQYGAHPQTQIEVEKLVRWWEEPQLLRLLETVITRPIRTDPEALAVFWAALTAGSPGTPVTFDDIAGACSWENGDSVTDLEAQLQRGLAVLTGCPSLVAEAGSDTLTLISSGALLGLRSRSATRLRVRLEEGLTGPESPESPESHAHRSFWRPWRAYRYALMPEWRARISGLGPDPEADQETVAAIPAADEILTRDDGSGSVDAMAVIAELFAALREDRPDIALRLDGPDSLLVDVGAAELTVVLFEVLDNAAEAVAQGGQIQVTVQPDDPDALILVQDSGGGIPDEIQRLVRIFRTNVTTKEAGRGFGLHLARELVRRRGGDIDTPERRDRHPVLHGAKFQIMVPLATGSRG
jgi:two-component sensor histidine kinase